MSARPVCSILVAVGILTACDSPTTVAEPLSAEEISLHGKGDVVARTSGGGKAQLPAGFSLLKFSFDARLHRDGSAAGEFRQLYESASGTVDFQGDVTCVSFDPVHNRAWVGGVVTRNNSTNPGALTSRHEVGDDVWFRVVDNGEGGSPDDRTTVLGFEPGPNGIITSAQYCAQQPWTAGDVNTWAVISGNIQVEP